MIADYRFYRSNALWFSSQKDGYDLKTHSGYTIVVEKGNSKKWANYYLGLCEGLWKQPDVRNAVLGLTGTASSTNVDNVDSKHATNCLCLECLKDEIRAKGLL